MWASGVKVAASGAVGFQSKFSIGIGGGSRLIPNTTWTQLDFQDVNYDTLSEYDTVTNKRFNAQAAGWYHLSVTMAIFMNNSPTAMEFKLTGSMGDVPIGALYNGITDADPQSVAFSGDLWMDAGAHIEVLVYQSSGGNREIRNGTVFSGHRFA